MLFGPVKRQDYKDTVHPSTDSMCFSLENGKAHSPSPGLMKIGVGMTLDTFNWR